MAINVSANLAFENKDFLRNTAKNILTKSGASQETSSKISQIILFDNNKELYSNAQLDALKASILYSVNGGIKKTEIKKNTRKRYTLGELWNSFDEKNEDEANELYNFSVDYNRKNIFAAA